MPFGHGQWHIFRRHSEDLGEHILLPQGLWHETWGGVDWGFWEMVLTRDTLPQYFVKPTSTRLSQTALKYNNMFEITNKLHITKWNGQFSVLLPD